jgi:phosphoribosylamine--glycine ligase
MHARAFGMAQRVQQQPHMHRAAGAARPAVVLRAAAAAARPPPPPSRAAAVAARALPATPTLALRRRTVASRRPRLTISASTSPSTATPINVLVVGSGGREHALTWKLAQSPRLGKLFVAPGSPGTAREPRTSNAPKLNPSDSAQVVQFCRDNNIGLVVVGPEAPLVEGLVDALQAAQIPAFGPTQKAAQLEGSKRFMKDLCRKHGIPTAAYESFTDPAKAKAYVDSVGAPIVVKTSGLAAGKGVIVAATVDEAKAAVDAMLTGGAFGPAGEEIVVEEFLDGEEASFFALLDGEDAVALASAQDHKAALDGDRGPNTGGMGAYSPAPVVTPEVEAAVMRDIVLPTARAMVAEGAPFRGVLFAGLMIKPSPDGPAAPPKVRLLEHNVRFGDPECQVLMARLDSDLLEALLAACEGRLKDVKLSWRDDVALTVVMASRGYPGSYPKGAPIPGLPEAEAEADAEARADGASGSSGGGSEKDRQLVKIFHSGTSAGEGEGGKEVLSAGGRVLAVTALGPDVATAQRRAYGAVRRADWGQAHYRTDIGWRAVAREREAKR